MRFILGSRRDPGSTTKFHNQEEGAARTSADVLRFHLEHFVEFVSYYYGILEFLSTYLLSIPVRMGAFFDGASGRGLNISAQTRCPQVHRGAEGDAAEPTC